MKKIHTRFKRHYAGLTSHKNWYHLFHNVKNLRIRPKTFATEENAKAYAEQKGITKYTLEAAKKGKRWKIVEQEIAKPKKAS